MGYLTSTLKEIVRLGALGGAWALWLLVLIFATGALGGAMPGPFALAAVVMIAGLLGGVWLGLRVLGNPVRQLIESIRRDIEHHS